MFDPSEPLGAIDDEWPRLIFTRGHPALAMETRVALTPCMVGGADPGQDRVGLPCAGNHHGTADYPREGQDQGGSHPVSGATKDLLGPMRIATPFIVAQSQSPIPCGPEPHNLLILRTNTAACAAHAQRNQLDRPRCREDPAQRRYALCIPAFMTPCGLRSTLSDSRGPMFSRLANRLDLYHTKAVYSIHCSYINFAWTTRVCLSG